LELTKVKVKVKKQEARSLEESKKQKANKWQVNCVLGIEKIVEFHSLRKVYFKFQPRKGPLLENNTLELRFFSLKK